MMRRFFKRAIFRLSIFNFLFFNLYVQGQNVNQFTGSFNYNVPLIHVPSNRGTGVDIHASYNAGIQMNQTASEIGLGWNLDVGGAIYRTVSGIPDDMKNFNISNLATVSQSVGQGALYPEQNTTGMVYDLNRSKRGLDTNEFVFPDFDSYNVSAPSFTGKMELAYYRFYHYTNVVSNGSDNYEPVINTSSPVYRKPQFHFVGDFADTLVSRHYSVAINGSTPFRTPYNGVSGNGYTNSTIPFIGKHLNGSTITDQNFDTTSSRLATSNFVEYFTNSEIQTAYLNNFATGPLSTFIDYSTSHSRSSLPGDGIGYFRITASSGLTYHYALPVYELESTIYRVPLNKDYSLASGLTTNDFSLVNDFQSHPSNSYIIIRSKTYNKYAVKWLLTAITGPDYVDSNSNHVVDDADAGYWVSYDYKQWSSGFVTRSPTYGYDFQYEPDSYTQYFPEYFPLIPAGSGSPYKLSGLYGNSTLTKREVYYLSKIKTSSHTAILVHDIRKDEKGSKDEVVVNANTKPAPDLSVKRIFLFKNDVLDSLITSSSTFSTPANTFNTSNYSQYDFTNVNNTVAFYTEDWYDQAVANSVFCNYCVLKQVEFDQDYSLCRNYHSNVEVNYVNSSVLTSPGTVESNISVGTYSTSGKLTLNRILFYEFQNVKLIPSLKFNYDVNTAMSNPDFNPKKTDYWGYYKSDATNNSYSRYTTTASKAYTKAWSLYKITDALGGITEMEYESNSYSKVLDVESSSGFRGAAYLYRILNATQFSNGANGGAYSNGKFNIDIEEANTSQNSLTEFSYFNTTSIPNLKTKICIPYMGAIKVITSDVSPLKERGFYFGDCTYTVNAGGAPNYSMNNITGSITATTKAAMGNSSVLRFFTAFSSLNYDDTYSATTPPTFSFPGGGGDYQNTYSGNGFLMFETPVGYEVYGGGIRVKKLKISNSSNETYVTEYTYENGVATNEADRFEYPRLKTGCANSASRYNFLQPKESSKFDMGAYIGYSKVTVKNLGQINTSIGKSETTFITDPTFSNNAFNNNFKINSYVSTATSGTSYSVQTINECINIFASLFGAVQETKVFDKNNNMLTRSINEYTTTEQGGVTQNIYFNNTNYYNLYPQYYYDNNYTSAHSTTVNILRETPIVLKSSSSYGMGNFEKTETIRRDEITGETTSMRATGKNNSSSVSYKTPAYKHYQANDNISFTSADFRKVLPLSKDMYSYGNLDSTLTSNSFLTASYQLYSKSIRQRQYSNGVYSNNITTLPFYINNRMFVFDAGKGSMNNYGLLNKSNLYSNGLNLSTINNSLFWEPTGTYNWKLIHEVTLLDNYRNVVERRDGNSRFSADRYGYDGYYKTASVTNCNYASFTFAGFETAAPNSGIASMDGDILVNNHTLVSYATVPPHTGSKCIQVTSVPIAFTSTTEKSSGNSLEIGLMPSRIYRASVWAHSTNSVNVAMTVTVSGTVNDPIPYMISNTYSANIANNLITSIGNWHLVQLDFTIPENYTTTGGEFRIELTSANSGTVYYDDFIFHPVESDFAANVYNPRTGRVMSTLDANGFATNYFYDAAGRTTEIWKEIPSVGYKKVKKNTYNFARGAND